MHVARLMHVARIKTNTSNVNVYKICWAIKMFNVNIKKKKSVWHKLQSRQNSKMG